jgi:hypothetical protein
MNIGQSVKVIEFENFKSFGFKSISCGAEEFVEMCQNFEDILIVESTNKKFEYQKKIPKSKALHVFDPFDLKVTELPKFPQIQELFMHEGLIFSEESLKEFTSVGKISIYKIGLSYDLKQNCPFNSILKLPKLEELIFQDCSIMLNLTFEHLKILKLVRCDINKSLENKINLFTDSCEIDELYVEDCKNYLWLEKILKNDHKIKHLKIVNMKLPIEYCKLINNLSLKLNTIIIENVSFVPCILLKYS